MSRLSSAIALSLAVILVLVSGGAYAGGKADPKPDTKAKEAAALQERIKALGDNADSPEAKKLGRDVEAWAKKHRVQAKTESTEAQGSPATASGPKPAKKCKPGFLHSPNIYCVLDASTSTGKTCKYKCYQIQ